MVLTITKVRAAISFANPDIRWERASTFNVGVDATFFNSTLTVSADYFNKITRDIFAAYCAGYIWRRLARL
jgi:outer membrane receptor protein involved in Fe transport